MAEKLTNGKDMSKNIVLITGAFAGIGKATALAFAKEGHTVVISGRSLKAGEELLKELHDTGASAELILADVQKENQVKELIEKTVSLFGRIDVAINNAGIEGELGPISSQTLENYRNTFDTNVLGVLLSMKFQLPQMMQQKSGSIINISSIAGEVGFAGGSVYVASKHAVNGLTKCAALEAANSGVRVNAISPGFIITDLFDRFSGNNQEKQTLLKSSVPMKRFGTVDEVAELAVFLGSDKSKYFSGQSIVMDGGYIIQ